MRYQGYTVYSAKGVLKRAKECPNPSVMFQVPGGYVLLGQTIHRRPNPAVEAAHTDPHAEWIGNYEAYPRINDLRDDMGLPRVENKLPFELVQRCRQMRQQGALYREIAQALGVSISTARDWCCDRRKAA